jgi:hypothetical protein
MERKGNRNELAENDHHGSLYDGFGYAGGNRLPVVSTVYVGRVCGFCDFAGVRVLSLC